MKKAQLTAKLKELLPDFEFQTSESGSIFGTKHVKGGRYLDDQKNEVINSGLRHFFVSSVMYKNDPTKESFRYMIMWTSGIIRLYRSQQYKDIEIDKFYVSGKTDDLLIENLITQLNKERKTL